MSSVYQRRKVGSERGRLALRLGTYGATAGVVAFVATALVTGAPTRGLPFLVLGGLVALVGGLMGSREQARLEQAESARLAMLREWDEEWRAAEAAIRAKQEKEALRTEWLNEKASQGGRA